jgi:hypothetical protein
MRSMKMRILAVAPVISQRSLAVFAQAKMR